MKALVLIFAAGILAHAQSAAPGSRPAEPPPVDYRTLKFPTLAEVKIPDIPVVTLPNGIRLYLLENHTLPLVSGFALVRTGNLFDPKDKIGLATITGMVMRTGGTKNRTGEQLDVELENIAASVESSIGESSGRVGFSCLKENLDQVLGIFKDVLTNPEFRQDKIDLAKTQLRGGIARRNDDAGEIASREFASVVYGKDNPYGWDMEYATIEAIKRDDLVNFYRRYFFPGNIMMAIQGDFFAPELRGRIEKLFADWSAKQDPAPPFPTINARPNPGLYLATKNDVTQTFFRLGHLGGVLKDPDYPALTVMSDILGGSFSSRLFTNVRTKLGYVYSVGGGWGAEYDHPGLFAIAGSTKSASTVDALRATRAEIDRIRTSEVTTQELEGSKQTVLNGFVFHFDHPSKTLARVVTYDYYGYPHDFIFKYQKAVEATTKADVLRVAKSHIHPEVIATIAVGKPSDFGKPLTDLGAVKEIDLTIPEPGQPAGGAKTAAADSASLAKGKQLLGRLQQAVGGPEKLAAIHDLNTKTDTTVQSPQGPMTLKQDVQWVRAGGLRSVQEFPFGKITIFFDGKGTGWAIGPQGEMPLPPPLAKQIEDQMFRVGPVLFLSDRDPARTVSAVADNKVEISDKQGHVTTVEIGPDGLPLSQTYRLNTPQGSQTTVERYSDWKESNGYKYPSKVVVEQNGNKFAEATVTEFRANSGLKLEDLSKKP